MRSRREQQPPSRQRRRKAGQEGKGTCGRTTGRHAPAKAVDREGRGRARGECLDNNGLDVINYAFGDEGPTGLGGHEDEEAASGSDDPDEAINKSLPPSPRGDAAAPAADLQVQEAMYTLS